MAADHLDLVQRVRALLGRERRRRRASRETEVEPTLTEGYARVLELEAECLRLEHRIDQLTRAVADGHEVPAGKLSALLDRRHETEQQWEDLRALLVPLRRLVATAA